MLTAEAPDEDTLRRVEHPIADRLERIGRRDHRRVTWTLLQSAGGGDSRDTRPTRQRIREDPHMAVMNEDPDNHARQGGHAHD